ncbi:hypothetical protein ANO14919_034740 [Xylariales sp. No.14919]|nr:hypothetical protein ANO14919_034740 [Xylariales sp. No.14919]
MEGHIDKTNSLIAIYTSQAGICLLFLIARFWSRSRFGGVDWDDACMAFSWASYAALTVQVALQAVNGGFRDAPYRDVQQMAFVLKLNYIARPFAVFSVLLVKIAVGYLVLRILGRSSSKGIKYFVWTLLGINTLIGVLDAIFTFTQCDIPAALWDVSLAPKAHCWNPKTKSDFGTFSASLNVVTDFILAVLPAAIVWRLQLSVKKRLGLAALLGAGILSVISAAIKTYKLSQPLDPKSGSIAEEAYELYAWTSAEIFILQLCASLPPLKPIWDHYIVRKKPVFSSSQGYKLSNIDQSSASNKWAVTSSHSHLHEDGLAKDPSGGRTLHPERQDKSIYVSRSVTVNRESSP